MKQCRARCCVFEPRPTSDESTQRDFMNIKLISLGFRAARFHLHNINQFNAECTRDSRCN